MNHLQLAAARRFPWLFVLAAALLLLALATAAAPGAAAAQGAPDTGLRDFQRISDYVLVINGREAASEIYQSQRAAALLVLSSALPSPVLLMPGSNSVTTVFLMKIDKKPDGSIDLLPGAALQPQGGIEFQEEEVRFKADGKSAVLKTTPPLLGPHRVDEVTAHNPEYVPRAAAYNPNPQNVAALKRERRPVTVRIFFGSWCPHCREMVPHAIKLEQALRGSPIHFEYFGLPPHFGSDPTARANGISAVPTGIVYLNGKEIGRIQSFAWNTPETTLAAILNGGKS
jgi:thiol-disulfide isomerase/thioredoxin